MIKLPRKYAKMIASIEHETDGYFINTQAGYSISDKGCHTYSVDTIKEIRNAIQMIEPCNCKQCQYEKDNPTKWPIYGDTVYIGDIETVRR